MSPSVTHFKPKLLSSWKWYLLYQHQLPEKMRDKCYCIYAEKHEHKTTVTGGREAKLRRHVDTLVWIWESDKWYVTRITVLCLVPWVACAWLAAALLWFCFVGVVAFCSLFSCVAGWRLHHKTVAKEKVLKTYDLWHVEAILTCVGRATEA